MRRGAVAGLCVAAVACGDARGPVAGEVVWSHTFGSFSADDFAASGAGVWPDGAVVVGHGERIDDDGTEMWQVEAFDASGRPAWTLEVTGRLGQCLPALAAVPGGDAIVVVLAEGAVEVGGMEVVASEGPQLVATRIDDAGAARWVRVLASHPAGGAWSCPAAAARGDGTFVLLAGAARGTAIDLGGGPLTHDDGDPESEGFNALAGFDGDGAHLWSGALALEGRQRRATHAVHPDGRVAVVSTGWSDGATLLSLAATPEVGATGAIEPLWQVSIECLVPDLAVGVEQDAHIHVSGSCGSNGLTGSFDNAYLARFTADGEPDWSVDIGDRGFLATQLPSGSMIGATDEGFGGADLPFLAEIDEAGDLVRREELDVGNLPMGAQYLQIVKSDAAGRLVLAGSFEGHLAIDGVEVPIDSGLTSMYRFLLLREASGR